MIQCSDCHRPYPPHGAPFRCLDCGGVFDFAAPLCFDPQRVDASLPGIWRYRHTFCLSDNAPALSLGEGNTPLVWNKAFGKEIAFKLEFLNPTGSFKDRGAAPLVSLLLERGVSQAVEDSSGNAGASFAAYAAAAGIKARVYVPGYASGPKRAQIEAYGAEVERVPGLRAQATQAVLHAAAGGVVYASHAYMPHELLGYATIAYELIEQLGGLPGSVVSPAGQGSLLLGIGWGFQALSHAGITSRLPVLVGVQALACAPLWAAFTQGELGYQQVREEQTLAEGVRVRHPLRMKSLLSLVRGSGGKFVAVSEENILSGQVALAHRGLFVEPTSAIVWDALVQMHADLPIPIVVILTGTGLKTII